MRTAAERQSEEAEKVVRDIRRATRRQYTAEEKVRIVIAGLRGEESIAELCRKEGINQNLYYRWSKEFFGGGQEAAGPATPRAKPPAMRSKAYERKPTAAQWIAGQITGAFPWDEAPSHLIRDRDGAFGRAYTHRIRART